MAVCSQDVEAVVCDRCFFMEFDFVCNDERITYPVIHFTVHGEHDGAKFESLPHSIHKLRPF